MNRWARAAPGNRIRSILYSSKRWLSTAEQHDPTAALCQFYGEPFQMPPDQRADISTPSLVKEACRTPRPLTIEALLREETGAEVTVYRIDHSTGKPPIQLVLQLGTNRERKSLAEALLRRVCEPGLPWPPAHTPLSSVGRCVGWASVSDARG